MELLDGPVRDYDWGSTTAIPELLGRPVTGTPVAEVWFGAHPSAPALVGSGPRRLDSIIADDPIGALGPDVARRFGSLPFLLKVLAAESPLSLQAHPSTLQAEAGFAREEAAGIALDARERSFRDPRHKPELICALSEFEALCGFREVGTTLELLATVATPALDPVRALLDEAPDAEGLRTALRWLLTQPTVDAADLTARVVAACREGDADGFGAERAAVVRLGTRYPGDAGVVLALLLNLVVLQPGEALFLEAGNLHAYLHGTGVEIMANSDNVLRGGLTSKHIDVPTLLDVVDPRPIRPEIQRPDAVGGVVRYAAPVPEFALERIELDGELTLPPGPAIVLCTRGHLEAAGRVLDKGGAAWIPHRDGPITLDGVATVFHATTGPAAI